MNSSTQRRIVVVGAGNQAWYRLDSVRALEALADAEGGDAREIVSRNGLVVVGICDMDPSRAQARADEFGIPRVYASFDAVITDPDVDAVMIITPHHTHADLAVQAMNAGKDVFCDKPMSVSLPECERMVAAAAESDVELAIGYQYWYWTSWLASTLAAGEIGDVTGARIWWTRSDGIPEPADFWRDPATGGVKFDLVGHLLTIIMSAGIAREFASVTATSSNSAGRERFGERFRAEDTVTARLVSPGGVVVTLDASWADQGPAEEEIGLRVYGTEGEMDVLFPGPRSDVAAFVPVVRKRDGDAFFGPAPRRYRDVAAAEILDWLRAMNGEKPLDLPSRTAVQVEQGVHAIAEAAASDTAISPGAVS